MLSLRSSYHRSSATRPIDRNYIKKRLTIPLRLMAAYLRPQNCNARAEQWLNLLQSARIMCVCGSSTGDRVNSCSASGSREAYTIEGKSKICQCLSSIIIVTSKKICQIDYEPSYISSVFQSRSDLLYRDQLYLNQVRWYKVEWATQSLGYGERIQTRQR